MVEKLRSILRRTSWSLVLKAVIFGVAWWALPFWLFFLIALYLYFVPAPGAQKTAAPFFTLLLVSFIEPQGIIDAVIFGAIFYFIILIKDLIIIDRRSAYEILMLILSYLLVRVFFLSVGGSLLGLRALFYSLIAAWAISALVASFIKNFSDVPHASRRMVAWMIFFLMWQLFIVGLFLPLDFLYQSAVVFLLAIMVIHLVPQYVFGQLSRIKVLATGMVLFMLLVIVLSSARWVL